MEYGGVYLDHDFLALKNIERLLGYNSFVMASEETNEIRLSNALIASSKDNLILSEVLHNMGLPENNQKFVTVATGPVLWTNSLKSYLLSHYVKGLVLYHPKYLFPCLTIKGLNCGSFSEEYIRKQYPDCFLFHSYYTLWWDATKKEEL